MKTGRVSGFVCHCCRLKNLYVVRTLGAFHPPRYLSTAARDPDDEQVLPPAPKRKRKHHQKPKDTLFLLGKLRGSPGKELRERSAVLGTESLGKLSEVIILKDAKCATIITSTQQINNVRVPDTLKSEDIVASIKAEKLNLTVEEVQKQINSLRPAAVIRERILKNFGNSSMTDTLTISYGLMHSVTASKIPLLAPRLKRAFRNRDPRTLRAFREAFDPIGFQEHERLANV